VSQYRATAAAAALFLVAFGVLFAEGALVAAAIPLAAWALASSLAAPPRLDLEVGRTLSSTFIEFPAAASAQDCISGVATNDALAEVMVEVKVRNKGDRIEALDLADTLPRGSILRSGAASWHGSLDTGEVISLRYSLGIGRGAHTFRELRARAHALFLAAATEASIPCPGDVVVAAPILPAPSWAFAAAQARPFSGLSRAIRSGNGTDFAGTREYWPGDPLRNLNWRAEALWGQEVVNIHEEERALDIGIILDCRAQAYDRESLFEAAVSAAASAALTLLDGGHRVAFLSYGSTIDWTPPGAGRGQRIRIGVAAAKSALGDHAAFERFDNIPVKLFPPRSLVLLVSPLAQGDLVPLRTLIALGYTLCVLKPDILSGQNGPPPPDEASRLAREITRMEEETLEARLLRAGATILAWDTHRPLSLARLIGGRRFPDGTRRSARAAERSA
jgi:uncharacterized protein (DUF58 family)